MNASALLIFPHQLFPDAEVLSCSNLVYLIEETLFFHQFHFHQQKLVLHRASMKAYEQWLKAQGKTVMYIEATEERCDVRLLIAALAKTKIKTLYCSEVADNWLRQRLVGSTKKHGMALEVKASPNFLNTPEQLQPFFQNKKSFAQTPFYIAQRKQLKLLLNEKKEPLGGKWTFDTDNRKKYPKQQKPPTLSPSRENEFTNEAIEYVSAHFSQHHGCTQDFIYPVTYADAELWLDQFLAERFRDFGAYEDAMVQEEHFLHHAVLTPMLNIGLLSPQLVIDKSLKAAAKFDIPLNSLEGFVRQVVGWREFIRGVYHFAGSKQRTSNYWIFKRKIPACFWDGTTGIEPVDAVIKKTVQTGYSHHIERLMVMGNFMLLCEFDPDEVYRWFMEMYVDAYDWVMVPNVYGMSQFADGGLMSTKPYISGSNYLLKMSDFKKGSWTAIWDGLFWRFMHEHRSFFLQNPRLGMLVKMFDQLPDNKQQEHLQQANEFLARLDDWNSTLAK